MTELEEQTMRKQQFILGWLCTVLPFVSIGFGLIGAITKCNPPTWWYSISATFYTNSNVVLIGLLFATGIYFWAYEGYDKMDNIVTKLCAIFSFMTIAFPTQLYLCEDKFKLVGLFCLPNNVSYVIHCISSLALYAVVSHVPSVNIPTCIPCDTFIFFFSRFIVISFVSVAICSFTALMRFSFSIFEITF